MRKRLEVNQRELAQILGKTTRLVRYYQDQGLPSRAEGAEQLYYLPDAISWIIQKNRRDAIERSKLSEEIHA